MENNLDRIRDQRLKDRVVTPEEAASWIESGMTFRFKWIYTCW